MTVNDIIQNNNKVLVDKGNKTVKLNRLKRIMKEVVPTFQSLVEAEQKNGGPDKMHPLESNENPTIRSNQEQGMDQSINIWKGVESHTIAVFCGARVNACGKPSQEIRLYSQRRNYTGPQYYPPIRIQNFQRTLMMERNWCSETT